MSNNLSDNEILKIFQKTEIFHGSLNSNSILFKLTYKNDFLYFLLYDYKSLYFSKQSNEEILSLNKLLNNSLEFTQLSSLISFLKDNLITQSQSLEITQSNSDKGDFLFYFERLVDILVVKYQFICAENGSYELMQKLFIRPMNNILLSLSAALNNGISLSDIGKLVDNNFMDKKVPFTKEMEQLTIKSSIKVNEIKEDLQEETKESSSNNIGKIKNGIKIKNSKKRNYEKAKFIVSDSESESKEDNQKKSEINEEKEEKEENNNEKFKVKKKKKMKFI